MGQNINFGFIKLHIYLVGQIHLTQFKIHYRTSNYLVKLTKKNKLLTNKL